MGRIQQDVRMRILLAARELFARQGYDGTSVRQICEAADSNIALISYHFGGKERVFLSLFEKFSPVSQVDFLIEPGDPVGNIREFTSKMLGYKTRYPEMLAILQHEIFMNSPRVDAIKKYTVPIWERLRNILEEGRQLGIFSFTSLDSTVRDIIALIVFPCDNPIFTQLATEKDLPAEELVSAKVDFILSGLKCTAFKREELSDKNRLSDFGLGRICEEGTYE